MEEEYVALQACTQEVNLVNELLGKISEEHKPEVVHKDNQGEILLANNRQVGMHTKPIDTCNYFMRYIPENKDLDINYIRSKENPADIMMKNLSEAEHAKQTKIFTEGELWDLMEIRRENVKNNEVLDGVMDFESTEYSSHTLANTMNQENRNE